MSRSTRARSSAGDRRALRARLPAGRDAEDPAIRCNGFFRFGRLLRFARHAGRAPGDGTLRPDRRARRAPAPCAPETPRRTSRTTCSRGSILVSSPASGSRSVTSPREETRAEAERAGLAAARRAESQEACFLGGDDYRAFLSRQGLNAEEGPVEDEQGEILGPTTASGASHRDSARASGWRPGRGLRASHRSGRSAVVVGARESLARRRVRADGRLFADASRVSVKLRYRSPAVPGRVEARARGF